MPALRGTSPAAAVVAAQPRRVRVDGPDQRAQALGGDWTVPVLAVSAQQRQGLGALFVRMLAGSYSNVVGLPLFETAQMLRGTGYPIPLETGITP